MASTLADVTPELYKWAIEHMVPVGELSLLVGEAGSGKGTLLALWASAVTNGTALAPGAPERAPGSVILVSPEDRAETTLAGRYDQAGARLDQIFDMSYPDGTQSFTLGGEESDLPLLEARIKEAKADPDQANVRLVIIDGLNACAGVTLNTQKSVRREIMEPLQALAWEYQIAIVLVHHFNKSGQVGGSSAVVEAARLVLEVKVTGDVRALHVLKTNMTKPSNTPIYYTIQGIAPRSYAKYLTETEAMMPKSEPEQAVRAAATQQAYEPMPSAGDLFRSVANAMRT